MAIRVLFVDDDNSVFDRISHELRLSEIAPYLAVTADEALELVQLHNLDVVIMDAPREWNDSATLLEQIKGVSPLTEVIVRVSHDCTDLAIEAMKRGAYDYLADCAETSELLAKITRAKLRKTEQEVRIQQASMDRIVIFRERW
jgi:DNA-binding NtrC family response regulator